MEANERKFNDIMVIDDQPENLEIFGSILNKKGYKVSLFPSGKLAVNALKKKIPDLILLDVMMPEMDGFKTLENIKEIINIDDVPVVFVSAVSDIKNKLKAFKSGGVDYITKPFYEEEVLERIKTHLSLIQSKYELKKHREELEYLVYERTRDLENAQKVSNLGSWKYNFITEEVTWTKMTYKICDVPNNVEPTKDLYRSKIIDEDKIIFDQYWDKLLKDGHADCIHRIKVYNEQIWVKATAEIVYNHDKKPWYAIGTVQDINQMQNLTQKNQLFSTIINQSPLSVIITDVDSKIEFVNPSFEKITGYKKEEALGKKISIINSGYHSDRYFQSLWNTIKKKKVWQGEIKNKKRSGDTYWDRVTITPVKNDKDIVTNYVAINIDITEKINMERKLIESEEKYRTIYENTSTPMYIINPNNGNIIEVNKAFEGFYGWDLSEDVPLNVNDISEELDLYKELLQEIEINGFATKICIQKKKNKRKCIVSIFANLIKVNNQKWIHVISFDITNEYTLLERLTKQNDSLKEISWKHSHELRAPLSRVISLLMIYKEYGLENFEMKLNEIIDELSKSSYEMDNILREINSELISLYTIE